VIPGAHQEAVMAAARSLWSGSISFGLVNIPVKLYTAVREHRISFHLLHDQDHVRLQRKMVCPADGKEVHSEHQVRGYEVAPDQYVIVRDEELEALAPEASRSIQISDFVDLDGIDPIFYDRPYYLMPDERAAKAFSLLHEAMRKSKKVAIATFVMRGKEYLAAMRPLGDLLCLSTMHFSDEVVPASDLDAPPEQKVSDRELKMAQQLINSLDTKFDPKKYHDEYQARVKQMLEKKAEGEEIVTQAPVEKPSGRAVNLLEALEASLATAKKKAGANGHNGHNGHATTTRRRKSA
jgi:DNA end-binding protein Ku